VPNVRVRNNWQDCPPSGVERSRAESQPGPDPRRGAAACGREETDERDGDDGAHEIKFLRWVGSRAADLTSLEAAAGRNVSTVVGADYSVGVSENTVPGFLPSTRGFHFANRYPPGPTVKLGPLDPRWIGIGDASTGLCGGMCFTVRDLFEAGVAVPPDRVPPANGTPQFQSIVRRQVVSLDWLRLPVRFWLRSALGGAFGGDRARTAFEREWPKIRREIDDGRLVMLGLIRVAALSPFKLTGNHQVIAFGYAEDGRGVTLRLYDPNWPDRDDVTVTLHLDPALRPSHLEQSTGEPLLGWFVAPYTAADPRAWR
jgi:hypothetical protein